MGPAWPLSMGPGEEEMKGMSDTFRRFLEPLSAQNHLRPLGEEEALFVIGGGLYWECWEYDPDPADPTNRTQTICGFVWR